MKIIIRQDVEKLEKIRLPSLGFLEINSEEYKKSLIAELKRNCY